MKRILSLLGIVCAQVPKGGSSGFGLLSLAGVVGTGVAGALYYIEREAKTQAASALESVSCI